MEELVTNPRLKALRTAYAGLKPDTMSNQEKGENFAKTLFSQGFSELRDDPENQQDHSHERTKLLIEAMEMAYDPTNQGRVGKNPRYLVNALLRAACNSHWVASGQTLRQDYGFEEPPVAYPQLLLQLKKNIFPNKSEQNLPHGPIKEAITQLISLYVDYFDFLNKKKALELKKLDGVFDREQNEKEKAIKSNLAKIVKIIEWTSEKGIMGLYHLINQTIQEAAPNQDFKNSTEWICMEIVHALLAHQVEKEKALATIDAGRENIKTATALAQKLRS